MPDRKFWGLLLVSLLFALGTAQENQAVQNIQATLVRVIHLSPNTPAVDISLVPTSEEAAPGPGAFSGLAYAGSTDYAEVAPGDYTVSMTSEGSVVLEQEVEFSPGLSYTIAVTGLLLPEGEAEEEGGFFDFIENLFSGDSEDDSRELNLLVLQDSLSIPPLEGETLVRLVHVAPGTDAVALRANDPEGSAERVTFIEDITYGEASEYTTLPAEASEPAVVLAGSDAVAFNLADTAFERGTVNTLFVTGTPLEQAPLTIIDFSDAPRVDPTALAATAPLGGTDALGQSVGDVVLGSPDLATLALALDQGGLLEPLRGPGPYTLFAPSEEAFAALPEGSLDTLLADPEILLQVLNHHVVQGALPAVEVAGAGMLTTLDGNNLEVTAEGERVTIGGANLLTGDVSASNGVVHIIDTVLLPEGLELTP